MKIKHLKLKKCLYYYMFTSDDVKLVNRGCYRSAHVLYNKKVIGFVWRYILLALIVLVD